MEKKKQKRRLPVISRHINRRESPTEKIVTENPHVNIIEPNQVNENKNVYELPLNAVTILRQLWADSLYKHGGNKARAMDDLLMEITMYLCFISKEEVCCGTENFSEACAETGTGTGTETGTDGE